MKTKVVCFDVETTGLSDKEDYIIQLAMSKFDINTFEIVDSKNWYIEPIHAYEISPGAIKTHGITKEYLKEHGVNIKDIAQEIIDFVEDSDYLTYNGNSFDVRFIYKDLKMAGYEFPIKGKQFYDAYLMYKKFNPCTLSHVYESLTGEEMADAHDAFSDVEATISVFRELMKNTTIRNAQMMPENQLISPENSIRYDVSDNIIFNFGKYKDAEFCKVLDRDPSYVKWFLSNISSDYTKKILKKYYKKHKK